MHSRSSASRPGAFIASEYTPYDSAGTAEVESWGTAEPGPRLPKSLVQRTVVLTPVTSWSQRWWNKSVLAGQPSGTPEPRVRAYMHATEVDSSGHSHFKGLPEGRYYVLASMLWVVGRAGEPGSEVIRVWMGKQFALAQGEHATITLDSLRTDGVSSEWYSVQHGQALNPDTNAPY